MLRDALYSEFLPVRVESWPPICPMVLLFNKLVLRPAAVAKLLLRCAVQPGGMDANERVFVGGLPYYLTEEQCRELLGAFGPIKTFDLVKDRETGHSKG